MGMVEGRDELVFSGETPHVFFEHALVLVGKSAEVVVPLASIAKYWMLPDPDNRGHFFALTLAAPVANGKSQLHHVSLLTKEGDAHPKPSLTLSSAAGAAVVDGTLRIRRRAEDVK